MAEFAQWTPRSAWAGIAAPGHMGVAGREDVTVTLLDGYGLASIIAPPDRLDALGEKLSTACGLALPSTPRIVSADRRDLIGIGPGQWLLRTASKREVPALMAALAPHAALADQSDARAALRLSGPKTRDVLAKGVMIDLHPQVFAVGDAAATSVAHIGLQLWRLPDAVDGPVFELSVARSYAGSFWSWLATSASQYGCRIVEEA